MPALKDGDQIHAAAKAHPERLRAEFPKVVPIKAKYAPACTLQPGARFAFISSSRYRSRPAIAGYGFGTASFGGTVTDPPVAPAVTKL
jgi:hypothetical protein